MKSKKTLLQQLKELQSSDYYPYHMPGHKRNKDITPMGDIYGVDITEIDDFDNLHEAEGVLRDIEILAASVYGAQDAFLSVNGSTAGILSAVMSQTEQGDKILMARGCHKSVYHAVLLNRLNPVYLLAEETLPYGIPGEITASQVAKAMEEEPACRVVLLTSPTYEGLVLDIEAIAKEVHKRNSILIVDAAHGAHFGISDTTAQNPIKLGADLVIVSLHKTMPAMTQTALVLVNEERIQKKRLKRYLTMVQTSSPSYVLMASMEESLLFAKESGKDALSSMTRSCDKMKEALKDCRYIEIFDGSSDPENRKIWDAGKIVIAARSGEMSGPEIYNYLREKHHLQLEMAADRYVLAMFTMADGEEAFSRMTEALLSLDEELAGKEKNVDIIHSVKTLPKKEVPMWEAQDLETAPCLLNESCGFAAAEFVGLYPPGIPVLAPGELIEEEQILLLQSYLKLGMHVQGIDENGCLSVCYKK